MSETIIHLKKDSDVVGKYAKTTWRTPGKLRLPCAIHIDAYDGKLREFLITVLYDGRKLTMGLGQPLIVITEEEADQLANLRRQEVAETEGRAVSKAVTSAKPVVPKAPPQTPNPVKPPANPVTRKLTCYGFLTAEISAGVGKDEAFAKACGLFPDRDPKKIKSDISVVRSDLKKKGVISY
jgi:hypothetical protein